MGAGSPKYRKENISPKSENQVCYVYLIKHFVVIIVFYPSNPDAYILFFLLWEIYIAKNVIIEFDYWIKVAFADFNS